MVAIIIAVVGVYIATKTSSEGLKPYTLQETLPQMVSDFGAKAKVVQISVSHDDVDYQVIPSDGRLHIRNYDVVSYEVSAGTTGYNRKVSNDVRAPTRAETGQARVTLDQIDPGVADRLLDEVGFSRSDSTATLSGNVWLLDSYHGPSDDYVAAVDGTGVRHVDDSNGNALMQVVSSGGGSASATTQSVPAVTSTVSSLSTTISVQGAGKVTGQTKKLLACMVKAQGDVNKILKCQERFPP